MAFARSTLGALLGLASSLTSVVAVLSALARIAEAAERVVEPELIADIPCDEVFFGIGFADIFPCRKDHRFFLVDDEFDELLFRGKTRTYVFDLSDLDAPVVAGLHFGVTRASDHNQFVAGNHTFQANFRGGLRVLRLGDLSRGELAEVAMFDTYPESDDRTLSGAWGVYPFFESGVVVATDLARGLFVLQPTLSDVPECADGLDNDADGYIDGGEDPACGDEDGELPRNHVVVEITSGNGPKPGSRAVTEVVLLGSQRFDPASVDPATLLLEGAPLAPGSEPAIEDVAADGFPDLVVAFRTAQSELERGESGGGEGCLDWRSNDGVAHEACDPPRSPAGAGAGQIPRCGQGFELALLLPLLCRRARRFGPGRV